MEYLAILRNERNEVVKERFVRGNSLKEARKAAIIKLGDSGAKFGNGYKINLRRT